MKDADIYQKECKELELEFCRLLEKYQLNKEAVPKEDLMTKYKKAFLNLQNQIEIAAKKLIMMNCLDPLRLNKENKELVTEVEQYMSTHEQVLNAALKKGDSKKFLQEISIMKCELLVMVFSKGGAVIAGYI